jgi:hypothetical protein
MTAAGLVILAALTGLATAAAVVARRGVASRATPDRTAQGE